ncbi:MAG: nucleotidyltransferase family protein [Candidatus Blackburnbacteria bacterium]|nr:nucleotidyltransferase family protein [Candidatus Blackburnbacteria bacterium]
MTKQLEEIKAKAVPILKEAGVKRSSVFGSYARGDYNKKSDVDILIDAPDGMSLFDLIGLQHELEDALNKKVDLGEYSAIKPRIKERVLSEAVQIL